MPIFKVSVKFTDTRMLWVRAADEETAIKGAVEAMKDGLKELSGHGLYVVYDTSEVVRCAHIDLDADTGEVDPDDGPVEFLPGDIVTTSNPYTKTYNGGIVETVTPVAIVVRWRKWADDTIRDTLFYNKERGGFGQWEGSKWHPLTLVERPVEMEPCPGCAAISTRTGVAIDFVCEVCDGEGEIPVQRRPDLSTAGIQQRGKDVHGRLLNKDDVANVLTFLADAHPGEVPTLAMLDGAIDAVTSDPPPGPWDLETIVAALGRAEHLAALDQDPELQAVLELLADTMARACTWPFKYCSFPVALPSMDSEADIAFKVRTTADYNIGDAHAPNFWDYLNGERR